MNAIKAMKTRAVKTFANDAVEKAFFKALKVFILRLVESMFLFKKRKGEVVSGATTFFAILSFGPAILLLISVIGMYLGDSDSAKDHVINTLFLSFPKIEPYVLGSLKSLVEDQISSQFISIDQLFLWFFACLGISTSFVFGINILSKVDPDGGFFQDDLRSVLFGVVIAIFFLTLFIVMEREFVFSIFEPVISSKETLIKMIEIIVWPLCIAFLTLFYKYSTRLKVSFQDAFQGALVFAIFFLLGKYFYWIYLTYFKEDLLNEYGEFYNYMILVIWLYYIVCSFYLGASFTFVSKVKVFGRVGRASK